MSWDFPVEGRLFILGLVAVWVGLIFYNLSIPTGPGSSFILTGVISLVGVVLLILSYLFGRTAAERARDRKASSS